MVSGGSTLSKVEHLPAPDHLHWLYFNTYCFYTRAGCGYTGLRVDKSVFTNDSIDCPANHPWYHILHCTHNALLLGCTTTNAISFLCLQPCSFFRRAFWYRFKSSRRYDCDANGHCTFLEYLRRWGNAWLDSICGSLLFEQLHILRIHVLSHGIPTALLHKVDQGGFLDYNI